MAFVAVLTVALLAATATARAAERGRVLFISLDGLGHELFTKDPAGRELKSLSALVRRGAHADGMIAAFPSTTANSHAALWTGAYAGHSGILYNRDPLSPRSEHTFSERGNGFRSEELQAEPIWVTAARQGVSVTAHQVTQAFPFLPQTVGDRPLPDLLVMNGYQSRSFAPWRVLRRGDVKNSACDVWKLKEARTCFEWAIPTGDHEFPLYGAILDRGMLISLNPANRSVRVELAPEEREPPRKRALARRWSEPLPIDGLPENVPASLVFRLFELNPASGEFVLVQGPLQETALFADGRSDSELARRLVEDGGPMAGNGAHALYVSGAMGALINNGGSGAAERRYLETVEWVVRQQIRHSEWLLRNRQPRLHITYLPFPDEVEHTWLGLDRRGDSRVLPFRKWGYVAVDRGLEALMRLAQPSDHVVVASDHGMAPVHTTVSINVALQQSGLLALTRENQIDVARSKAMIVNTCILLNTEDWKDGILPSTRRGETLAAVERALTAIRDPDGRAVITRVYRSEQEMNRFGLAGPSGADACFDLLPGYGPSEALNGPVLAQLPRPTGVHGFDPTRPDMEAVLVVAGPRLRKHSSLGKQWSVSVAPLIADLLGIEAPRKSGSSPLSQDAGVAASQ